MRFAAVLPLALIFFASAIGGTDASALQVTPVRIQVEAPAAASTITVSNSGAEPVVAQLRIFKWVHVDGKDDLQPTTDVVASPPLTKLAPGQPYVVRIIRVAKTPVAGEETYRLLVDEVPNLQANQQGFGPRFAIRQSIPVFFTDPSAAPRLSWSAAITKGKLLLRARNDGTKRVRISALVVSGSGGAELASGKNLISYVFGRSTEQWAMAAAKRLSPGTIITILAQGDNGPIKATAKIEAAN